MRPSEAIKVIKERLDIVDMARRYVDLKPNGARFVAPCPFHQETKPSFSVNPENGLFYCFGCHASGDIFDFYSKVNGLDFKESLEQLALEAGIRIDAGQESARDKSRAREILTERQQMLRMHEAAAAHFASCLKGASGAECRRYVQARGLSADIVERFGLGWAERGWHSLAEAFRKRGLDLPLACQAGLLGRSDNGNIYDRFRGRLVFPIKNLSNQIIAFGGRIIAEEDEAKYINSPDSPIYKKGENLYGLSQARRAMAAKGLALLTEGYMDVLTLHQYGYDNGVGVLGTALTYDQVKRLSGFTSRVLLLFDGDRPGRKAALRACEMLLGLGLSCQVVLLPDGEDIDSLLRGRGKDFFDSLARTAPDGLRFCVDALNALAPREAVEWAKNFLRNMRVPELVSPYASALAQHLGIAEDSLREGIAQTRKTAAANVDSRQRMLNMRDMQIMIFAARYPHRLEDLRDLGADLALSSARARQFWDLIEQWGPNEVTYHLDERQKDFWFRQRGPGAAPLSDGDYELECLRQELSSFYDRSQKNSLNAALNANKSKGDFATDLEFLRALQNTLEKSHEQS